MIEQIQLIIRKRRERKIKEDNQKRVDVCSNSLSIGIDTETSLSLFIKVKENFDAEMLKRLEEAQKETELINKYFRQ